MSDHPTPFGGSCRGRFEPLRELFAAKLESGEDLGASVAVNIDGETGDGCAAAFDQRSDRRVDVQVAGRDELRVAGNGVGVLSSRCLHSGQVRKVET